MGPKTAPRDLSDPPKEPQEGPKMNPKEPQEGPKRAPRRPQEDPKRTPREPQDGSKRPPINSHNNTSTRLGIVVGWAGGDTRSVKNCPPPPPPPHSPFFIHLCCGRIGSMRLRDDPLATPARSKAKKKPRLSTNVRVNGWIATEGRRGTARWPHPAKRGALKPPWQKCEHHGRSRDSLERCDWDLRAGAAFLTTA